MIIRSAGRSTIHFPHWGGWNPGDAHASFSFSDGNLLANSTAASYKAVRASIGRSSGKFCFEVTVVVGNANTHWIKVGIIRKSTTLSNYIGAVSGDPVYDGLGTKWCAASSVAYGTAYGNSAGAVVGAEVNLEQREIGFYLNGVYQGIACTGLAATDWYPALTLYGSGMQARLNLGWTPFAYSFSSGYKPWGR